MESLQNSFDRSGRLSIRRKPVRRWLIPLLFVLPAFLLHFVLISLPTISSIRYSFTDWNIIGAAEWCGWKNYIKIFKPNSQVLVAFKHNLIWMAITLVVPNVLGVVVALMVSRAKRGQIFYRAVYYLPYVISAAVIGKVWVALFNPYYGINSYFKAWGWDWLANISWLGNPKIALYTVAFVDIWHAWGFNMTIFLSALQQVDPTLYEAARIDGANRFQEFWHVTVPGIKPTIAFMVLMTVMWSFLSFNYVWVMTNGGPGISTEMLATIVYREAFGKYNAGYACAICVLQCLLCIGVYFLNSYVKKKGELDDVE